MSDGRKQILSPFIGHKKQKTWNKTEEKCMPVERIQNLAEIDRGSYYNQEEWLEEFLDMIMIMIMIMMIRVINEFNEQEQLSEGFTNNCCKIVSPVLLKKLIRNFIVCKQCSGTLLLAEYVASSHVFGKMWNFLYENENCFSSSLKARPIKPKRNDLEIDRAAISVF